jgi:ATP-dependent Lhr-like helicase
VALFLREHAAAWQAMRDAAIDQEGTAPVESTLSSPARWILETLRARGALFFRELEGHHDGDRVDLAVAVAELVAAGLVTSDGFAGLRAIVRASAGRPRHHGMNGAGRWSAVTRGAGGVSRDAAIERQAMSLLRRYGVVFRRLLTREANAAPWRELTRVYRRLEARGEIRGGRFVSGMSGEQFALGDAVERLRETRRKPPTGRLIAISAADPLNLAGIVTTGERVRAVSASRLVYRDGVPLAALEGEFVRSLTEQESAPSAEIATALAGRRMPPIVSGFLGQGRPQFQ